MRVALAAALLLLASFLIVPGPAQAQTYTCGDIQLVFRNPDLQPREDGFIHAQGQFFVQFQAIGETADQIEVFGFSFGPYTVEFNDQQACSQQPWITGVYVPNYRADRNPDDGFFIPLKTTLVPDGTYAAAVHAYDANNNELARFWARAVVDNCDPAATAAQERCDGNAEQAATHDKTAPWPIVLPGDGQPLEGHTWTVEFAEPLAEGGFKALLNGEDVTAQMESWEGRIWDADYVPDYGPSGVGAAVAEPCTQPYHSCIRYGPAFTWKGRALTPDDIIRIEARDVNNNTAVKDIHLASSAESGAITGQEPMLVYSVAETSMVAEPGGSALFRFEISNSGGGTGHPYADATVPEGWAFEWQPMHVAVDPGKTVPQELLVTVPADAADGRYAVNATLTYRAGGTDKVLAQTLTVVVGDVPEGGTPGGTPGCEADGSCPEENGEDTPSMGAAAVLALLAALAVARRRR